MSDKEHNSSTVAPADSAALLSPTGQVRGISNEDLMIKLCENGKVIEVLRERVEKLCGDIFDLQQNNDRLQKEVADAKKREVKLISDLQEAKYLAQLVDSKVNDLALYSRRNNLRIYGIQEESKRGDSNRQEQPQLETSQECEQKVLQLFKAQLKLNIRREDIEAVHRLGRRQEGRKTPRGIIVRFVSRRTRDDVIFKRRNLRGTGVVVVEDLTPTAHFLLHKVKEDPLCDQAWTKYGKVLMKTTRGKIVAIQSLAELSDTVRRREQWSNKTTSAQTGRKSVVSSASSATQPSNEQGTTELANMSTTM